jgi:hypothetical protein
MGVTTESDLSVGTARTYSGRRKCNQQQQINALMVALKEEKEMCILVNKTFDSTASYAVAAIELAGNEKAIAVNALDKEARANTCTIFQRHRHYLPGNGKWKNIAKKLFQMNYVNHLIIL